MSDGENNRIWEVNFVGVLVNSGGDDWGVDDDRVVGCHCVISQLHAGIVRRQVAAYVFVQDKGNADLTCKRKDLC